MKKLSLLLSFLLSLAAFDLSAQSFTGVDIWSGSGNSLPYGMTTFGNKVFFEAQGDTAQGYELWSSDGTQSGTTLVKDIWAGKGSSSPFNFTELNGKLYFTANDSIHGNELWVTDGTGSGTTMVYDINPGLSSSSPSNITVMGGKLYFQAADGTHGYELWVSDGTGTGTALVKDINPGINGSGIFGFSGAAGYYIHQFTPINGKLYFSADDGTNGTELWSTDGTSAGTTMIDLWAGPGSSTPYSFAALGSKFIFTATDSLHGSEIWISDGTAANTAMLKDINPGTVGSDPADYSYYMEYNGKLYFSAYTATDGYELWATDGTTAGTTEIKDIWAGPGASFAGDYGLFVFKNKLYFNAADSLRGSQLWTSDGTPAGTTLLKVLSTDTPFNSEPLGFTYYNGQMLFQAKQDATNGAQLYTSDGTAAGTHLIQPAIAPNTDPLSYNYGYQYNAIANGIFFFEADYNTIGGELWTYTTAPNSITETSGDHTISAYPNPFSSVINLSGLQSSNNYTVEIMDIAGRVCYKTTIDHPVQNAQVSMPDLSKGVYLMQVSGQGDSQTFKLTKN